MSGNNSLHRIGILEVAKAEWTSGWNYTRTIIHSLRAACKENGVDLTLLSQRQAKDFQNSGLEIDIIPLTSPTYFRGERRLREYLGLPEKTAISSAARKHQISVLLSLSSIPIETSAAKVIGWIPDFQHVYLPEFFSEAECRYRDINFRLLAQRAALVMLSSRNVLEHFVGFTPENAHKGRVVSFPSLFAFEPPKGDALSTLTKFNLPAKFALVANQFWRHKNHLVVVDAIHELHRKGIRIPVVMTGLPADYRDPTNQTISSLLQAIASAGLVDQITVLGLIPYADLVNLMRTAAVIIQPSRFEGWSTIVQDSKAMGRPLICSDISLHREQAPEALGFFPWNRPDILADLLAANWKNLEQGPDPVLEEKTLAKESDYARQHGQSLLAICKEAYSI